MLYVDPLESWLASIKKEQPAVLATILQMNEKLEGCRIFIPEEGIPISELKEEVKSEIIKVAKRKLKEKNAQSELRAFYLPNKEEINVFIDVYVPPINVIIFGAGHDAIPLAKYCAGLRFNTTVVDSRTDYNNEMRFPNATRIISTIENIHKKITINNRTYIIIMNHHLEKDQQTLSFALKSSAAYVGVLGPLSRCLRMLKLLKQSGIDFEQEQLTRMYSPVGLDIGAGSPEEIALSITAEILAVKNGHSGRFLKGKQHIHQRLKEGIISS